MAIKRRYVEVLAQAAGDGATLTAAAAASATPAQARATLEAGYMDFVGKMLRITASGKQSVAITTPGTIAWSVRFGGTTVWDGLAMVMDTAGYTNVGWWLTLLLRVSVIGAAAQLVGQAVYSSPVLAGNPATPPKGSLTALLPWNTAPGTAGTAFDGQVSQLVDLFYTPSLGTASMTLHEYLLEALN